MTKQRSGHTTFGFPAELTAAERAIDPDWEIDWRVEVDYGEDGEHAADPAFTFYRGPIYYGTGVLGFRQGGVGHGHGPSHPSRAVWGPYLHPAKAAGGFRVPASVQAETLQLARGYGLIEAPAMSFVHPRSTSMRRNPREVRWPKPVEKIVELIWRLVEATYPDLDELNPVTVEHDDDRWTIGFTEDVILYGLNEAYVYTPSKRTWKIYLDTNKTKLKQSTAQVEARVRQLINAGVPNPGYELVHYVIELTRTGDMKRVVTHGGRKWWPDWSEAMQIAGELTAKHPRSAGFEVVSEPMSMQANPGRNRFSELAARDLLPVAIWSESVPPHALLEWRGPRGDIWAITDRAGNDVLAEFARQYADAPAGKKNPASATVYAWLAVLKSKLTQYDRKESMRELRRGHENIYRLGHLLGAAQSVEKAVGPYLNRDDAEALAAFEGAMDFAFTPNFPPVNNVKRQLAKYRASGKLPSLVG